MVLQLWVFLTFRYLMPINPKYFRYLGVIACKPGKIKNNDNG